MKCPLGIGDIYLNRETVQRDNTNIRGVRRYLSQPSSPVLRFKEVAPQPSSIFRKLVVVRTMKQGFKHLRSAWKAVSSATILQGCEESTSRFISSQLCTHTAPVIIRETRRLKLFLLTSHDFSWSRMELGSRVWCCRALSMYTTSRYLRTCICGVG